MISTADHTAIVTGATSGIGLAVARALAADGTRVLITGRDPERGAAAARELPGATFLPLDLAAPPAELRTWAAAAIEALGGRVDVLVNNAGIYPVGPTAELADDDLDALLAVNLRAPHVLVGALAPAMARRGTGAIVNVGSWMASVGVPMGAMYTATKAALEQCTRTWAAEYGPRGVRVNTVAPGATLTPGNAASRAVLDQMTAGTPAGEVVLPEDIAAAVRYLVSPAARMVHGVTLAVDGGMLATRSF